MRALVMTHRLRRLLRDAFDSGVWFLYAAAAAISLWLRFSIPLSARAENTFDDALFVRAAQYLLHHQWLGPYDDLTLAKGMFFSLFIACMSWLSIPLRMGEQIVYLAAAAVAGGLAGRFGRSSWFGATLFVCLIFDPLLYGADLAFVLREGLYVSFPLAVIALYALIVFGSASLGLRLAVSAGLGLVLGAFWLTREEGVWILPSLACIVSIGALDALTRFNGPGRRDWLRIQGLCAIVAISTCAGCNLGVASINKSVYGVFETTEFKSSSFVRSYSALAGIDPEKSEAKVVIPHAARQLAYAASPAFKELEPFLDGMLGDNWRLTSCHFSEVPPSQCTEILAGWFMWALRDSVAAAGHAGSAREADKFYKYMATELDRACANGTLHCADRRPSLAPPFRWQYVRDSARPAWKLLKLAATVDAITDLTLPDTGTPVQMELFRQVFGQAELDRNQPDRIAIGYRTRPQHDIIESLAEVYKALTPMVLVLGIAGVAGASLALRHVSLSFYAMTLASLAATACRICLLAYLDATSIPASFELYLACITPLVIFAAVAGCYVGLQAWTGARSAPNRLAPPG